jgi:hypothetical protein
MRPLLVASFCALALLVSCASPTIVCGCLPDRTHAVVYGAVTDASGAPVQDATIVLQLFEPGCATGEHPVLDGRSSAVSASGEYRLRPFTWAGSGLACVRVSASAPGAAEAVVVQTGIIFRPELQRPDSVRIDLRVAG